MSESIRLLLVDDHKIIINGIRVMLEGNNEFAIVGEANDGKEAVDFVQHNEVDVVLMDIKMPVLNGIEATAKIAEIKPNVKVLALTMFDDDEYITSMLQAGARGYVLKNTGKNELLMAIEKVNKDETYFSSEVTNSVMNRFMNNGGTLKTNSKPKSAVASAEAVDLTEREVEILRHIAYEMTNQEIADKLFISPRTVHSHRRNLMQKIGVKNTAGLVRYAIQHGLLDE